MPWETRCPLETMRQRASPCTKNPWSSSICTSNALHISSKIVMEFICITFKMPRSNTETVHFCSCDSAEVERFHDHRVILKGEALFLEGIPQLQQRFFAVRFGPSSCACRSRRAAAPTSCSTSTPSSSRRSGSRSRASAPPSTSGPTSPPLTPQVRNPFHTVVRVVPLWPLDSSSSSPATETKPNGGPTLTSPKRSLSTVHDKEESSSLTEQHCESTLDPSGEV